MTRFHLKKHKKLWFLGLKMQKKRRFGIIQFARLMMAEWQSAETLHPGASREAAIKMAGGLSIMSNMGVSKGDKESLAVTDGTIEKADAGMGSELSEALSEGKSLSDEKVGGSRVVWVQNVCFDPSQRFVGKLIRVPSKG